MSYGIVRVQKFRSGSIRGIDIHDNRIKEFSHTNPDIDFSKTEDNYNLKSCDGSFYNSVNNRIKELNLKRAVRKDAVVMAQVLITSDRAFFDGISSNQQEKFFKKSYDFIENRYGKENIISATVHLDEKTPHMHINFVPITPDGRLCAKDVLNKKEIQSLQNETYKEIFKDFRLQRGESRKEKRKHLSVEQYKIKTDIERLKAQNNKLNEYEKQLQDKEISLDIALNAYNTNITNVDQISIANYNKDLLGSKYKLTEGELKGLITQAKKGVLYDDMKNKYDYMGENYKNLKNKANVSIKYKSEVNTKISELSNENRKLNKYVKSMSEYLEEKKLLKDYKNTITKTASRSFER